MARVFLLCVICAVFLSFCACEEADVYDRLAAVGAAVEDLNFERGSYLYDAVSDMAAGCVRSEGADVTTPAGDARLLALVVAKREFETKSQWKENVLNSTLAALTDSRGLHASMILKEARSDVSRLDAAAKELLKKTGEIRALYARELRDADCGIYCTLASTRWRLFATAAALVVAAVFFAYHPYVGCVVITAFMALYFVGGGVNTADPRQSEKYFQLSEAHARLYADNVTAVFHALDMVCEELNLHDMLNNTIKNQIIEFSRKIFNISLEKELGAGNLETLNSITQLRESRNALVEKKRKIHGVIEAYASNERSVFFEDDAVASLKDVVGAIERFEETVRVMETDLYAAMSAGESVNRQFSDDMTRFKEYITSGKLLLCMHILTKLDEHQQLQLHKLNSAVERMRSMAESMVSVRKAATSAETPLSDAESAAHGLKMVFYGLMTAEGAVGAVSAAAAVAGGSVVAAPVALSAGAAAAFTYGVKNYLSDMEDEARLTLDEVNTVVETTLRVTQKLSEHRAMIGSLAEDVRSLISNIQIAHARFESVKIHPYFTQHDMEMLNDVCEKRVKPSLDRLSREYARCMQALFDPVLKYRLPHPERLHQDGAAQ